MFLLLFWSKIKSSLMWWHALGCGNIIENIPIYIINLVRLLWLSWPVIQFPNLSWIYLEIQGFPKKLREIEFTTSFFRKILHFSKSLRKIRGMDDFCGKTKTKCEYKTVNSLEALMSKPYHCFVAYCHATNVFQWPH